MHIYALPVNGRVTLRRLRQQGSFPLAAPSAPGRSNVAERERFKPGDRDRVRVRTDYVPGHVRMPGYIRGKTGVVVSESPAYPFPDAHAHGVEAEDEPTYDVRFRSEDLWHNSADPALVHVAVFQTCCSRHSYVGKGQMRSRTMGTNLTRACRRPTLLG